MRRDTRGVHYASIDQRRGIMTSRQAQRIALWGVLALAAAAIAALVFFVVSRGFPPRATVQKTAVLQELIFPPLPESVVFIDRFRALDDSRWVFSDGWSNGAWMENDWRREALAVTPEGLAISMRPNPPGPDRRPYMSGELQSQAEYLYGYFEAGMRIPRGEGTVTGLFTYTRPGGPDTWEEIDIEFTGAQPRRMEITYHFHGAATHETIELDFDPTQAFHTYGFEWTADAIRWYVDNQLVHEARGEKVRRLRRPQRYYLNFWNSAQLHQWVGRINPDEAPWVLQVSCIAQARQYEGASLCAPPHKS
jgi:endo-1,3-1,4-beta-glycanase ExoK